MHLFCCLLLATNIKHLPYEYFFRAHFRAHFRAGTKTTRAFIYNNRKK